MNFRIELECDKGEIGYIVPIDYGKLKEEAKVHIDELGLSEESTNDVLAGLVMRELRPTFKGLLDEYDKGPPEKSNVILLNDPDISKH